MNNAPQPRLFDIVPTSLAVNAMRESGYKNAAYAIAELIDNAIQAGADKIELLCGESIEHKAQRSRSHIHQIAVLDDGSGMDGEKLRQALQFGNGAYLNDRSGMGRFGMGLPNSSISQCRRVDVWTWQAGPESAIHSYLDLGAIERGEQDQVPSPTSNEIPDVWRKVSTSFSGSGTLVVWSHLDRIAWKTANAIIRNSSQLVGRIYRRFLAKNRVSIRLVAFEYADPREIVASYVLPNDPMFLMIPSVTPAPYGDQALFEPYGDPIRQIVAYDGKEYEVYLNFSIAKLTARQGQNPGARPYGKHAQRNNGVSIVRAGRELELSKAWTIEYDPTERWWGVEVDFPPGLDEIFGVANNKQQARTFVDVANLEPETMLDENETMTAFLSRIREEEDPLEPLIRISNLITSQLTVIRRTLSAQTRRSRSGARRYDESSPEAIGSEVVKKRQLDGYRGQSDEDENNPPEERRREMQEGLENQGVEPEDAKQLAAHTIGSNLKIAIDHAPFEGPAFFSVNPKGGVITIVLNTNHPVYANLVEILALDSEDDSIDSLKERLAKASRGLLLLLESWARYEDEQPPGPRRTIVQDARIDWGRTARDFLDLAD